jgi:uncharacterized membrane protein HdeD (DUF308 family)
MAGPVGSVPQEVRSASGWSIVAGVILVIAGMLAIGVPWIPALVATFWVAWALVFGGVAEIIHGFDSRDRMAWNLALGLLYVAVGLYILYRPGPSLAALALVLGVFLLIAGIMLAFIALQWRPMAGWGLWLFDAIITLLLAFLILEGWPSNSAAMLGLFVGASMLISGVNRLVVGSAVRAAIPKPA